MVDTVRTVAALQTLLANNSGGDISPQDMRDVLVSLDDQGWADYADDYYTSSTTFDLTADTTYDIPINAESGPRTYLPRDVTALYDPTHLVVTGISGTFTVGETITGGTSSDTAVVVSVDTGEGKIYIEALDGDFTNGETITGGTSGATATMSGTRVPGKITGREGDFIYITFGCKFKPTTAGTTYADVWIDIGGAVGELYRRTISFPKGNGIEHGLTFTTGVYTLDTGESNGGVLYIRANATASIYEARVVVHRAYRGSRITA
jgi:hypothetical protein